MYLKVKHKQDIFQKWNAQSIRTDYKFIAKVSDKSIDENWTRKYNNLLGLYFCLFEYCIIFCFSNVYVPDSVCVQFPSV